MDLMVADISIGAICKNKLNQKHSLLQLYLLCFHYYCLLPAASLPILRGLDLTEIFQVTSLLCRFCHYEVELLSGRQSFFLSSFKNSTVDFFWLFFFSLFVSLGVCIFKTISKKTFPKFPIP